MNFRTYLGSGATMRLGLGVAPRIVRIRNLATGLTLVDWNIGMLANSAVAGGVLLKNDSTTQQAAYTGLAGLQRYFGGDIIATKSASDVVDPLCRSDLAYTNLQGAATVFIMDTAANGTGHIDGAMASGAGVGSVIVLAWRDLSGMPQTKTCRIMALTSTGLSADYVTIDLPIVTLPAAGATILWIGPAYDLVQAPAGMVLPAGVKLIDATYTASAVMYEIGYE